MAGRWKFIAAAIGLACLLAGVGWLATGWKSSAKATYGLSSGDVSKGADRPSTRTTDQSSSGERQPALVVTSPIRFVEQAEQLGIEFRHASGITKEKYFPAANGSGAALLDFDGDGRLDIYFLTACLLPVKVGPESPRNRIYRGRPGGDYEDISTAAGLDFAGFSQGVSVADVNNDGFPDLYVVALGGNHLFLNLGDGTFQDATAESGADTNRWGTSCAFLDYDEDGAIDLYVASYGLWSIATNEHCGDVDRGVRLFCRPTYIIPERHTLFRNRGDGTFEDSTERAGVVRKDGRGQGVIAADVNGDGHVDLYIANDMSPNFLFLNNGDGTFRDSSVLSGVSYDGDGAALASMGIDATDVDEDGRPELFVTNFANEYNNLYRNHGDGFFTDVSAFSGLGPDSLAEVGWGTLLVDLDNDRLPDVLVVNGHVDDNLHELGRKEPFRQKAKVWRNRGGRRFEQVSAAAGEYFQNTFVSRGAAFGDLNEDGRIDVVVLNIDERPAVLMNASDEAGWVRFQFVGRASNRDAVGCHVVVEAGGKKIYRAVKGGGSYLSAHDLRVLVGVGDAKQVDRATITWPSGAKSVLEKPELRQTHRAIEPSPVSDK